MKRSGKFYRKNEAEVMDMLGLKPTKNSGSGWIEKEDGQSEDLICQLKSTDASSIKIAKKDLDVLNNNAVVAHKLPIFAIQFLKSNEVYLIVKPHQVEELSKYLKTGEYDSNFLGIDLLDCEEELSQPERKSIESCAHSRELFNKDYESKFKKRRKSAL